MATLKGDIRQRELEAFEEFSNTDEFQTMRGLSRVRGAVVRAAVRAGWFSDLALEQVENLKPREVNELFGAVQARYEELTALDPL